VSCPDFNVSIPRPLNNINQCLIGSILILSLAGCSGGKFLQNTLAPDPKLTDPVPVGTATPNSSAKLVDRLPPEFPVYSPAKFQATEQRQDGATITTWTTPDPIDLVYAFYQKELAAKQWQIVTQPSDREPQLVANQGTTRISIEPQAAAEKQQTGVTLFAIVVLDQSTASNPTAPSPTPSISPTASPSSKNNILPAEHRNYLADLTQIGILSTADTTTKNNIPATSRGVTRREYSRWLIAAYNKINSTKPNQQIRLATADAKPAFQDVPTTHPDFPSIQGLAEAGFIPSSLSGDATSVLFRPDTPLTREQLILWKVPLDSRQPLPAASLDAVKQTWGFQDAGKVEPKALRAVLADFQNGEQSNIRRVFGYTTLFQPKKPVNLGEVAATIWYFGANSEGLSARDAISK
jgi:S-layer homology domain